MPEPKAQLIDPQGPIDVPGLQVTGVTTATGGFVGNVQGSATGLASTTTNLSVGIVTATKFQGNTTGNVSGLADDTNINVGIITSTSFTGDLVGNAAGLSTTTANIKAGIMSATSFAGNFTGVASGITGTPNIVVGIMTGTLKGDGSGLTGIAATNWIANNVTTTSNTTYSINVTASGSSNYTLSGNDRNGSVSGSDPSVAVNVGDTLNFAVNASGHPFYIRVSNGGANVSTPAATNQGTQSGTVSWTPNTAGTYYYQCGNHSSMIGTITVSDSTTSINLSDGNVIYFTQNVDTTVSFANTGTSNIVSFIRPGANYTITWPSAIKWDGGSAPTLNTVSGENEVFTLLTRDEGVTWYGWETVNQEFAVKKQLWAWGNNADGRLAQNNLTLYSSPVQVGSDEAWSSVGYSMDDGCQAAVKNGQLFTWGFNNKGSAGHSNIQQDHKLSSPTQVPGTNWSGWIVSAKSKTISTKTDGSLWSWGYNGQGQLGLNQGSGDNTHSQSSPCRVGSGTDWSTESGKCCMAFNDTFAIKTDGTLWAWGMNEYGSVGQNNRTQYSSPAQIPGTNWLYVQGGNHNVLATKTDGTLWGWGLNGDGELGLNNLTNYSSPTQIPGSTWHRPSANGTANVVSKTDGTLWSMGYNMPGFVGSNDRIYRSSPTQMPGTTWDKDKVRMSGGSISALKTDGTLWFWGRNFKGEAGTSQAYAQIKAYSSPVQVPGTWTDVGGKGGYATIALK